MKLYYAWCFVTQNQWRHPSQKPKGEMMVCYVFIKKFASPSLKQENHTGIQPKSEYLTESVTHGILQPLLAHILLKCLNEGNNEMHSVLRC